MAGVYDEFAQYRNGRGRAPAMLVLTVTPAINSPARPDIDSTIPEQQIEDQFNPWIVSQWDQRRWFGLVNAYSIIRSQPNWQSLYLDHVHLLPEGYEVLTDAIWDVLREYPVLGDANGDYAVDNLDIAPFANALFSGTEVELASFDVNQDGAFNNLDIAAFAALLVGTTSVPEPAGLLLALLGCVVLLRRTK